MWRGGLCEGAGNLIGFLAGLSRLPMTLSLNRMQTELVARACDPIYSALERLRRENFRELEASLCCVQTWKREGSETNFLC